MQDGAFQDLASTTALVKYVADAHGDEVEQWNGRRIFKEATEGNKLCMEGIDRMVDYLGKVSQIFVMLPIQKLSSLVVASWGKKQF